MRKHQPGPRAGREIRVERATGGPASWLCLRGTVLCLREKYWRGETTTDIPVELVTFSEKKRFRGIRLIAALLSLIFVPAAAAGVIGLWQLLAGPLPETVLDVCVLAGAFATLATFVFLLVRFFIRVNTISMHVAPKGWEIPVWEHRKQSADLRELVAAIRERQSEVGNSSPTTLFFATRDTHERPWRRAVVSALVVMLTVSIAEIPWLLLLGLIPIGLQAVSSLRGLSEPIEMRKARGHFMNREWRQAVNLVERLLRRNPADGPALLFLIELRMRLGDFDGARAVLERVRPQIQPSEYQEIGRNIGIRREIERRKATDAG